MIALVLLLLLAQAPPPPEGTAVVDGKVVDKVSGEPIAGAVVVIHTIGSAVLEERTTDSRGMFEFTRLVAGRYYLQATAGPFRYTHVPGGYRAPGADSGAPMELKDGDRRVGLVIELTRSLAIAGRVVDDEGHPLANLEVGVEPMAGAAPRITGRPRTTDDRGTFRIYGLSPGRYTVCAGGRMGASFEPESAPAKQFVRTCYPAHTETAEAAEVVLADTDVEGV